MVGIGIRDVNVVVWWQSTDQRQCCGAVSMRKKIGVKIVFRKDPRGTREFPDEIQVRHVLGFSLIRLFLPAFGSIPNPPVIYFWFFLLVTDCLLMCG